MGATLINRVFVPSRRMSVTVPITLVFVFLVVFVRVAVLAVVSSEPLRRIKSSRRLLIGVFGVVPCSWFQLYHSNPLYLCCPSRNSHFLSNKARQMLELVAIVVVVRCGYR